MDNADLLERLLELARDAGLVLRGSGPTGAEPLPASGVCRVRGEVWIVLSPAEPAEAHIRLLSQALCEHAADFLETRHLPPAVRECLTAAGSPSGPRPPT